MKMSSDLRLELVFQIWNACSKLEFGVTWSWDSIQGTTDSCEFRWSWWELPLIITRGKKDTQLTQREGHFPSSSPQPDSNQSVKIAHVIKKTKARERCITVCKTFLQLTDLNQEIMSVHTHSAINMGQEH